MWRRIVSLFHRQPCSAEAQNLKAMFADNLSAHERAGQTADSVTRSSDRTTNDLKRLRKEIIRRTELERRARPNPPTSHVRQVVEDVLSKPGLRGLTPDRDPS